MDIKIKQPLGYSHIGRKENQEDSVWPLFDEATDQDTCFVLCDGVGGSLHGEIASQSSSKVIGRYLTQFVKKKGVADDEDIQYAVSLAYDELEKIDLQDSEGKVSMATTFACVCIHKDGILAGHIGDSRIYHIRPGHGLLYQSADHSLVNTLLQAGEITVEEAQNFPRKNVITRAIQPNSKRSRAEVHKLTDIQSGDYLFLCSDGILEQLSNERLVEILSMNTSDMEKLSLLEQVSMGKTKDNFTAYLIPISSVKGSSVVEDTNEVQNVVVASVDPVTQKNYMQSKIGGKSIFYVNKKYILYICIFFLLLFGTIAVICSYVIKIHS